jgi:hypothetical protein
MPTCKQAEKRAFSIHGRDAVGLAVDFMRVCRIRLRKAAWHGRLRASRAQDRNSPTESHEGLDPGRVISVGISLIAHEHRGYTVGPLVDTAGGRCYGATS